MLCVMTDEEDQGKKKKAWKFGDKGDFSGKKETTLIREKEPRACLPQSSACSTDVEVCKFPQSVLME